MKLIKIPLVILIALLLHPIVSLGQETQVDSTYQALARMQKVIQTLSKIRISGYIQAQFQVADSVGIRSFAGGDFPAASDKRFAIRRGRIKFSYETTLTQYVLQVDATERGVSLKDAYAKVTEPWLKTFSLTAGVMNRPFGHEVPYSSSMRESPERGRMSQIIFPGERDLGAMLTIEAPKTSPLYFFKLEAGLYNGTGGTASDFDKQKDFIGHLTLRKSLLNEKLKLSGGASYYNGGWRLDTAALYDRMSVNVTGQHVFMLSSDINTMGIILDRNYTGFDFQASFETPVIGSTTIRAEYISGTQAGTRSSTASPSVLPVSSSQQSDAYIRKFNGAYFYFLQNVGKLPLQLIIKYDWYDPNSEVVEKEITSALAVADVKFSTLGLGLNYRLDQNIRFTAYYDMVENEKTSLSGYTGDIKDDVFTLRMQYKF